MVMAILDYIDLLEKRVMNRYSYFNDNFFWKYSLINNSLWLKNILENSKQIWWLLYRPSNLINAFCLMKSNTNIQRSHKSTGVKHIVRGGGGWINRKTCKFTTKNICGSKSRFTQYGVRQRNIWWCVSDSVHNKTQQTVRGVQLVGRCWQLVYCREELRQGLTHCRVKIEVSQTMIYRLCFPLPQRIMRTITDIQMGVKR